MENEKLRILLVDDDEDDFVITRDLLSEMRALPVELDWVPTFGEALKIIRGNCHDIYLFDYRLGEQTGLDMLSEALKCGCTAPMILLTGQGDHGVDIEAMKAGASDYLVKGKLDASMLERSIRYAIERKRSEEQIKCMAYFDSLTNLPNRKLFNDRLSQTLAYCDRHSKLAALMFLDLDHFKRINDTLGHAAGDKLLQEVASRLSACTRRLDTVARVDDTVARLGGDEFTIILSEIRNDHDAVVVAQRIVSAFSKPVLLGDYEHFVTVSIGITVYPDDGKTIEILTRNADAAMYHAKSQGRNNYQFYRQSMNDKAAEKLRLENDLHRALEQQEFVLYYQPIMDIKTGNILGMEALLRWNHPERGLVPPMEFIPQTEENGLIIPIGEWVINTACAQGKAWQAAGMAPVRIAVNLSARQFNKGNLPEIVARALRNTGLDPQYLELEVTESIVMHNVDAAIATLNELKALGLRLSMDDFGTGYSSFGSLRCFPIDTLKIDRSFVKEMQSKEDDAAIIRAILAVAKNMQLAVVAEGVENEAQLELLHAYGCEKAQGFLLSPPVPPEKAIGFLVAGSYGRDSGLSIYRHLEQVSSGSDSKEKTVTAGSQRSMSILMADDDEDDRMMAKEALEESLLSNPIFFVKDGEELMDYLYHRGEFSDPAQSPRPGLILLDLNMPRKDGREALKEIKSDPALKNIPIVVLTTSKAEEDVLRTYDLGVNSFIVKPVSFEAIVDLLKTLGKYWFELVEIPPR